MIASEVMRKLNDINNNDLRIEKNIKHGIIGLNKLVLRRLSLAGEE